MRIWSILKQAIADLNQTIKINPNHVDAYYNRGVAYYEQGKPELAKTDLEKAKQLSIAQGNAASAEEADSFLKQIP